MTISSISSFVSRPSLPLSVVSTELFAPHKMVEIRLSAIVTRGAGSENGWGSPICVELDVCLHLYSLPRFYAE